MGDNEYEMWTEITPNPGKISSLHSSLDNPLQHLKENYHNIKSPIAYSGVTNIYRYYGGKLSEKQIKEFLSTSDSYTLHKKSRVTGYNPCYIKYHRQQMQLDLVDIQNLAKYNDGHRFLLMGIDSFSRFMLGKLLSNKNEELK